MGLTKPRAYQIYDIDYKQAVRVVTITNINLTGGAPNQVDGVNLVLKDRILVTGQSISSENGIYYVTTVGSGSNGTWARSLDTDVTGELLSGTIVMATEGLVYADTQWKLITDDPITIGVTGLTFVLNSLNVYFTSISVAGNTLTASGNNSVVNFVAGTGMSLSGNTVSNTITFTSTAVGSSSNISNGTSNVTVVSSGGNVTVGVGGVANIANFTTTDIFVTANILPTANVTYNLGTTDNRFKDLWISNSSIYMGDIAIGTTGTVLTVNGANVLTGNAGAAFSTTGDITGGNLLTTGNVSASGNVNSANITVTNLITAIGNVQAGNLRTAGIISATANVTGGNLLTSGIISSGGNITSNANIIGGNLSTSGTITATGTATVGNVSTAGNVSATGNITSGNIVTEGLITATGTATVGNVVTGGTITATGNLVAANVRGNLLTVNTAGASGNTGDIGWNTAESTFNMYLENGVVLQAGQENNFWVIANGNITNGQVCAFAGAANNAIIASTANAAAPGFTADYVLGVATQDIADGDLGYVTTYGKVRDINTNAFNVGDILYLDPATPGGYVTTVPLAPNPKVQVAAVLQKGIANGAIVVRPTIFPTLENLQDVDASAVANKDYLRYTTSGNVWQHAPLDIADDSAPTLGGNLNAATYNISNVGDYTGGNITLTGAAYATAAITQTNQLATKGYVDTQTSTGLHIHTPVLVEASSNLIATYANGGSTQTVDSITSNKTLTFTTSPGLAVNDVIVFDNSFNGITGGAAYFVFSTNGTNQITLSSTYSGTEITNLTNGTSLAQPSRANSGVGATLTNAAANAAINISNVALSLNDRVIVTSQTANAQNGVYVVSTVGDGSTRWVLTRSTDTDSYGPQDPNSLGGGDYFYVTGGSSAGESYVCTNENVIIFGVTPITFTLFSAAPAYTGTSPVVVTGQIISLANTTGTSDVVVLQSSPTLFTPNIGAATGTSVSVTGNITGANIAGSGNLSVTGNTVSGNISTTGNVAASGYTGSTISVSGNVNTGNINGAGLISAVANVIAGNVTTAGQVSATGNITGSFFLGNGSQLTGITSSLLGNLAGNIEGNGFGIGGNLIFLTATGDVTGGNLVTLGNIIANGNITTTISTNANLTFDPDGTGYAVFSATTPVIIANSVTTASSPLQMTGAPLGTNGRRGVISVGDVLTFNDTDILATWVHSVNSYAQMILQNQNAGGSASADFVVNNDRVGGQAIFGDFGINSSGFSGVSPFNDPDGTYLIGAGGTLTVGTTGANNFKIATSDTLRVTVDTSGVVSVVGNVQAGNVRTAGLMSATGNIDGGNIRTVGLVSATGNILSAGNISGSFILGNGSQLTGISTSASRIFNGTSEANIGTSGGNANISIGGTSNVAVFATTGQFVTGLISATGNIVSSANVSAANVVATTAVFDVEGDVRTIIQNSQAGTTYTLQATDAGKHINFTGTTAVTAPVSVFSPGDAITVFNNQAANITIGVNAGGTLRLAGTATTGNRTLTQYGLTTYLCITGGASPVFVVSGAGLV